MLRQRIQAIGSEKGKVLEKHAIQVHFHQGPGHGLRGPHKLDVDARGERLAGTDVQARVGHRRVTAHGDFLSHHPQSHAVNLAAGNIAKLEQEVEIDHHGGAPSGGAGLVRNRAGNQKWRAIGKIDFDGPAWQRNILGQQAGNAQESHKRQRPLSFNPHNTLVTVETPV